MATFFLIATLVFATPEPAADAVTLKDGRVILGQVVEPSPRGKLVLIVRRKWAEENLADLARRWEAAEAPAAKRAREQRKTRLFAWRRERPKVVGKEDPIGDWLDREIQRLQAPENPEKASRLILVSLARGEAKKIDRRPPRSARMLRLAWTLNLPDAETLSASDLKSAIEGRGRLAEGTDAVPLDEFLPMTAETEARWMARRAATEVNFEPDLKFIRFNDMVLPEGANAVEGGAAMDAIGGALKGLLGEQTVEDPLASKLKQVAAKGRAGLLLTRLQIGEGTSSMRVETTLWVRLGPDRWGPAITRSSDSRTADARADEAQAVGSDPQVKAILGGVEALGLGNLSPDLKNAGASAKRALGQARSALQQDLDALALPVAWAP